MPAPTPGVYVVDDDEAIRDSLRLILEDEGYLVQEASDGPSALAFLEATPDPWVVLLDHTMPQFTGLDVLQALSKRPQVRARTSIIYLTARHTTMNESTRALLADGTVARVNKPFELDNLLAVVQQASQRLTTQR
jgi:CheY-like chemotaxis protein